MLRIQFKKSTILWILIITFSIDFIGDASANDPLDELNGYDNIIFISGNDKLDAFVAGNGTTGLTLETAHIIENFHIQSPIDDYGIFVQYTDRFLIIRNCVISVLGDGISSEPGIEIRMSSNVFIENCIVLPGAALLRSYKALVVSRRCRLINPSLQDVWLIRATAT